MDIKNIDTINCVNNVNDVNNVNCINDVKYLLCINKEDLESTYIFINEKNHKLLSLIKNYSH